MANVLNPRADHVTRNYGALAAKLDLYRNAPRTGKSTLRRTIEAPGPCLITKAGSVTVHKARPVVRRVPVRQVTLSSTAIGRINAWIAAQSK
jgi:hypothetical protein